MFTFIVFERKHPFWANLIQKIIIVSLEYFRFRPNYTLFEEIWSKIQKYLLKVYKVKLGTYNHSQNIHRISENIFT